MITNYIPSNGIEPTNSMLEYALLIHLQIRKKPTFFPLLDEHGKKNIV